ISLYKSSLSCFFTMDSRRLEIEKSHTLDHLANVIIINNRRVTINKSAHLIVEYRNRNLKTSKALLKSQAHQGTSSFTSAATNQRGVSKGGSREAQVRIPEYQEGTE